MAFTLGVSSTAMAQDCPPGSWFCGPNAPAQQAQPSAPQPSAPLPPPEAPVAAPPVVVQQQAPAPIIIYQGAPAATAAPEAPARREPPPPYVYQPRTPPHERRVALLTNLQFGFGGSRNDADATGVFGVGGGVRLRPAPVFALQGEVAGYAGRDYNGDSRAEAALGVNALFFLAPRARYASVYLLGGVFGGYSRVSRDNSYYSPDLAEAYQAYGVGYSSKYSYVGGQLGVGMEINLSKRVALQFDLRGFVRGRTDNGSAPEFVSSSGRATNTSGGGLLTTGFVFYF